MNSLFDRQAALGRAALARCEMGKGKITLVTGGAASGKSALAERICCEQGGKLFYIATMQPHGEEARARINKHRAARAGKGFLTVECPHSLDALRLPVRGGTALLEDLGNLAANEMFAVGNPPETAAAKILEGMESLIRQVELLVVVGNEMFAGGEQFDGEIKGYLRCVGALHRAIASRAVLVVESVCGLPLVLHGKL